MPPAMERRRSARLERKEAAAPYSRSGSGGADASGSGSSGLTAYMDKSSLGFDEKAEEKPERSFSLFGGRGKKKEPKLPRNWKRAKDKDGTIYYFNSVTQQRSHEVPPPLPAGWKEALHKESGRVYYYHKGSGQSTFEFPTQAVSGGADETDDDDAEPPPAPATLVGRTMSMLRGKGPSIARTGTMSRKGAKAADSSSSKAASAKAAAAAAAGGGEQRTVFISCSTLIKEVKLCVGEELQPDLDALFDKLTKHEIPAEQAVKRLMDLVGSTVVQQAGLSVMNAQKGVLPHGWLEYTDEASGRPYFYNVHTKVTTWYKPTGAVPPPPPPDSTGAAAAADAGMINLDCTLETHNVAMTGFI